MALVVVPFFKLEVLLEEVLPVNRQHAMDEINHTEFHRLHSSLLRQCGLHKQVSNISLASLSSRKASISDRCLYDLAAFLLFLTAILDVLLFAVEGVCDDLVRIGVSVVEVQLDAEEARDK